MPANAPVKGQKKLREATKLTTKCLFKALQKKANKTKHLALIKPTHRHFRRCKICR